MAKPSYLLSQKAEEDLRLIIKYTVKKHSHAQARKYSSQIERGVLELSQGRYHYRSLPETHPDLRYTRCEHHYIFGLYRRNQPILIIAILHERMDLIKRVEGRLK